MKAPRLTPATVAAIRAAAAAGTPQPVLAQQFRTCQTNISKIVRRVTWRRATASGEPLPGQPGGHRGPSRPPTPGGTR